MNLKSELVTFYDHLITNVLRYHKFSTSSKMVNRPTFVGG
jgi:hypothetical protein